RQAQDDRRTAERPLGHGSDSLHDPTLSEIVVHDEYAVGLQNPLDVGEGLPGKEIAFETNIRVTTMKDKRVYQSVDDKIVFVVGRAQKMPAVVQVRNYTGILVGMVRMKMTPDVLDCRIDLDRVNLARSKPQCMGEDVVKRRAAAVLLQQVNQGI